MLNNTVPCKPKCSTCSFYLNVQDNFLKLYRSNNNKKVKDNRSGYIVHESFISYLPSSISIKEKDDWIENSRAPIQIRLKSLNQWRELREHLVHYISANLLVPMNSIPAYYWKDMVIKWVAIYYQKTILETRAGMGTAIFRQFIKHHFKHRENNREH